MTILDACVQVLASAKQPLTAEQIFREVSEKKLYEFKAKEPLSVLRGTLRKHLRSEGQARIVETGKGLYRKI